MTENSAGIGIVSRKMVRERAVELAVIDGRSATDVSKTDWEQAKLELTAIRLWTQTRRPWNRPPIPNAGTRWPAQRGTR